MEATIINQIELYEQIKNQAKRFKGTVQLDRSKGFICARMKFLTDAYTDFKAGHQKIIQFYNSKEEQVKVNYFSLDDKNKTVEYKCRTIYEDYYTELLEALSTINVDPSSFGAPVPGMSAIDMPQHRNDIKLPRVEIDKFSGAYEKWITFQSIFKKMIHENGEYSNIQKFYYLKHYLEGEAGRLISHFNITDANYITAWEKL